MVFWLLELDWYSVVGYVSLVCLAVGLFMGKRFAVALLVACYLALALACSINPVGVITYLGFSTATLLGSLVVGTVLLLPIFLACLLFYVYRYDSNGFEVRRPSAFSARQSIYLVFWLCVFVSACILFGDSLSGLFVVLAVASPIVMIIAATSSVRGNKMTTMISTIVLYIMAVPSMFGVTLIVGMMQVASGQQSSNEGSLILGTVAGELMIIVAFLLRAYASKKM